MRIVNEIAVDLKKFDCKDGEKRKAMPFQKKNGSFLFYFVWELLNWEFSVISVGFRV